MECCRISSKRTDDLICLARELGLGSLSLILAAGKRRVAQNNAFMALNTVSLMLSKDMPVAANQTLDPGLRNMVGIGSVGAVKLAESNFTNEVLEANK